MRNAMDSNPRNWINCAMYVQDIASPDVNIAAEISKHEANNFKLMCTLFSSHLLTLDDPVSSLMTGEEKVLSQIDNELLNMRNQLTLGMSCESEITSILSNYIHQHRKSLKVIPFGSSQYGFQRPKTNFHLLINTSMYICSNWIHTVHYNRQHFTILQMAKNPRTLANFSFVSLSGLTFNFISKIFIKLVLIECLEDNILWLIENLVCSVF